MVISFQFQFVLIAFWGVYAIDREYIYPAKLDEFIPQLLNHFWVRKQFWMLVLCIDELSLLPHPPSLPLFLPISLPLSLPLSFLLSLPPSLSPSPSLLPPSAHHHNHTSTARSTPCLPSLSKHLQCSSSDLHLLHCLHHMV